MAATSPPFEALGGMEGCRRLSAAFYARVGRDPILRPLFPSSFHCAIESLALFVAELLGGPADYAEQRWSPSLRETHRRFQIGPKERDAWLKNMRQALAEVGVEESSRRALEWFFEQSSARIVNVGEPPAADAGDGPAEMARRWEVQRSIEDAAVAIRAGDADRAAALDGPLLEEHFARDRSALVGLMAKMLGRAEFEAYVRNRLTSDPGLVQGRYAAGRTLLHAAAGAGDVAAVELLLGFGAGVDATDRAGHTPLYVVANQCGSSSAADVVRILLGAGASVNVQDKAKRCTALHMAARRGNVAVAEALLDGGADLEARDSQGETPLRRAVNCAKAEVVAFLVARGADVHSRGSRGLTPLEAARSESIKKLLTA